MIHIHPATAYGDPREPATASGSCATCPVASAPVVMSNHRLLSMDNGRVKFFYKDYRDNERRKVAEVPALEFIDSFLAHGLQRTRRSLEHATESLFQKGTGSEQ